MKRAFLGALLVLAACGTKPPPVEAQPTATSEPPPPPPPIDAGTTEVDAAPEAAPPPSKSVALCSVPSDPSKAQCLTWTGCAGGIVETHAGKPIRKCGASADKCTDAENKLVAELDKLKGAPKKACKVQMYLKKEIRIDDASVTVCPEDKDDRELSELWRQIVATCKEPISS